MYKVKWTSCMCTYIYNAKGTVNKKINAAHLTSYYIYSQ